jgi:hypothetical protein
MKDFIQIFKGIFSAIAGVGNKENLAKDLAKIEKNSPWPYIFVGLIMVIIFIFTIILIVNLVL